MAVQAVGLAAAGLDGAAGSVGSTANTFLSGTAGAIAGAATASVIDGTDFGDNLMAAMPSVIASTVGNAIVRGLSAPKRHTYED